MAGILVVLMCAVADLFLVYVLFQFARELRTRRLAHTASAAIPVLMPARTGAAEGCHHQNVIDITSRSVRPSQNPNRRRAS